MIKCDPMLFIAATKWVLSDTGGRVWRESKNDIFVIDPKEMINVDHLIYVLKLANGHGWTVEDILSTPKSHGDDKRHRKRIFVLQSFREIQGFEAETVINFDSVVKIPFLAA